MNYFKLIMQVIVLLIVQPVFSQCLKEHKVYFLPLKEIYEPNDTIKITFEFNYERKEQNWLSAIEINYSDTWQIIEPYIMPDNCCYVNSFWEWNVKEGVQGFLFTDFRINEMYGDDCLCPMCSLFVDHFVFSWSMFVNDCAKTGDLIMTIDTKSDSEQGSWYMLLCEDDDIITVVKNKYCPTVKNN